MGIRTIDVNSVFGKDAQKFLSLIQKGFKLGFKAREVEGRKVIDIVLTQEIDGISDDTFDITTDVGFKAGEAIV